jgi:hypothetical protein
MMDEYFTSPGKYVLIDLREAEFSDLSRAEMVNIIRRFKDPEVGHSIRSAVVSENKMVIGLMMLMNNIGKIENIPTEYKLFRSFEEAENWLRS